MFNGLVDRVLSAPDSPTADLYFRNACADFLGRGVRQLAPTVFTSDTTCVIMRHAMRAGRLPEAAAAYRRYIAWPGADSAAVRQARTRLAEWGLP